MKEELLNNLKNYEIRKRSYNEEEVERFVIKKVLYKGEEKHPRAFAKMVAEYLWRHNYPEAYVNVPDLSIDRFLLSYKKGEFFEHTAQSLIEHANKLAIVKIQFL